MGLRNRLRWYGLILAPVLMIASGVNIWFSLSDRNDVTPAAPDPSESAAASAERWDPKYDRLEPFKALPTWLSYVTAFGFGVALPGLWLLGLSVSYLRWKVAAMKASKTKGRAHKWSGELGDKTLHGEVVAIDSDANEAFLVEIEQRHDGSEWKEISRRKVMHPFTMALAGGQHLRVEPDDQARLVDSLDEPIDMGEGLRRRRVGLTLGENVCVVGQVYRGVDASSGYRGASGGHVMHPPRRGRMLLSTGALERLFTRRARSARNWLFAWSFCFLLPCWLAYFPFWINALYGQSGVATVVAKETMLVKQDKKADYQTDVVTFRIDGTRQTFSDWLRPSAGGPEVGARVPVFYAPSWVTHAQVGKTPTVDTKDDERGDLPFFGAFFVFALMVVFGFGHYIRRRPWWERKRLDESLADAIEPEPQ